MKKIYSFVFAAVALFAAASCQKELVNSPEVVGDTFSFTATIGTETKTALAEDGLNVKWVLGDKVELFDADNKPVLFEAVEIMENGSALFQASSYNVPTNGVVNAVYNNPEKRGAAFIEGSVVGNLHIGGGHTAVAKGYDPRFGILFGQGNVVDGELTINFNNVNSLIKFTIAGEAPQKITLKCNGQRCIAGLFAYDFENDKCTQINPANGNVYGGAQEITLTPATGESFVSGETYYIPFIPGGNVGSGFSLKFDGTTVIDTKETIENIPHNKIFNLGTVEKPAETEKPVVPAIDVTRVWGHYGENGVAWSNAFHADLDGNDRSLAMDDKFIYVAQTTGSFVDANWNGVLDEGEKTFDKAYIHKFNISDGSYVGALPVNSDMNLGTHLVSCVRTVKKADGNYVLLACNLSQGQGLRIFAYVNGTDAEPVTMTTINNGRRWGDKFTVTGTWENGKMWFRSFDDRGMAGYVPLSDENTTWNWVEAHAVDNGSAFDANNISEVSWVPGTEGFCILNTNSDLGAHIMSGTAGAYTEVKTYPALAKTFGYNFFEVGDNKFVAWTSLKNGNALPRLQIVQSDATTLDKMVETFDNLSTRLVFEAPLQNENDMNTAGVAGGNTVGDCCVREINGEIYIAAMAQKAGLSLFKVTAK